MRHPWFARNPIVWAGAGIALALLLALPLGLKAQEMLGGRGRFSGKVVDERKNPIADVAIVVQSGESSSSRIETKTDAKGNFVAGGLRTGMWTVIARKEGFQTSTLEVEVRQLRSNPPVILVMRNLDEAIAEGADRVAGDQLAKGNLLLEMGKYTEARDMLEKFRLDHPEAYQVGLQIGLCLVKEGQLDKGEAELKALLDQIVAKSGSLAKEADKAMQALAGLGEAAVRRNDMDSGMTYFRQALEVSPTNEILAYNVAEILFSNGKTDEAIPYYQMAIGIKKEWPKPYHKLGMAWLNKGDFPKALEALRQFVALDPNNPAAAEVKAIIAAVDKAK